MTINYTDVDVSCIKTTELKESDRSKGQKIAFFEYTNSSGNKIPLYIQFTWCPIFTYGIPSISEYYKTDADRMFIKIPLDPNNDDIKKLMNFLSLLDAKLSSDEFKSKMFGNKASKYEYQPILRIPIEEDDDEDSAKPGNKSNKSKPKVPYIKAKIAFCYQTQKIKTTVFSSVIDEKGIRKREKLEIDTIDQLAENVCFLSKIHPIIQPFKLWAQPPNKPQPLYGASLKIIKMEVEIPKKNSEITTYMESGDGFISDDELIPAVSSEKDDIKEKKIPTLDSESDNESE
jgi:hypothetical protein